jgi:hypothetical protein
MFTGRLINASQQREGTFQVYMCPTLRAGSAMEILEELKMQCFLGLRILQSKMVEYRKGQFWKCS